MAGRRHTKRRTEITFETRRLLLVGGRGRVSAAGWCASCGAKVVLVTAEEAARLSGVTAREIFRRVEAGRLHFVETCGGGLLVCRESLNEGGGTAADGRAAT